MNKDIAEKWASALESGKYKQGIGRLAVNGSYCCLGVLCELYSEVLPLDKIQIPGGGDLAYGYSPPGGGLESATLPSAVKDWAEMKSLNGTFVRRNEDGSLKAPLEKQAPSDIESFSALNDMGATFQEIATLIRENVESL